MRRESDFFGDRELVLIYMARLLKHALAVEKILDEFGMDYFVETGHYQSGLLFPFARVGVFFYATPEDEARARTLLQERGYKVYDPSRNSWRERL
jgi:hypothetical protein